MAFRTVELNGFRSYKKAKFSLHPKLTLVIGKNGSGKTNLLESLYVLSATKSWRARDPLLLNETSPHWRLAAEADKKQLQIRYQPGRPKQIIIDGKRQRPENYIGRYPAVLFEPGSLEIVAGPPDARRRFLNGLLSNIDNLYLHQLIEYRRVLKQRNALLRSRATAHINNQVFAWDVKLVELAAPIVRARQQLVAHLQERAEKLYQQVSQQPHSLALSYQSRVEGSDYASSLLRQLQTRLTTDSLLGFTTAGPHRDELSIRFKGQPVANVASRGELRSITLVLKLFELEFIKARTKQTPMLLLDDVLSELDASRRAYLLEQLGGTQTVLTTTDLNGISAKLSQDHQTIEL